MKKTDYLTDEELLLLIESAEQMDLPSAPGYLKETILSKAASKETHRKHELFFFGAKVITAAAAAIALLITMPDMAQNSPVPQSAQMYHRETAVRQKEDSLLWKFNQITNQFCSQMSDTADFIFYKEEN